MTIMAMMMSKNWRKERRVAAIMFDEKEATARLLISYE